MMCKAVKITYPIIHVHIQYIFPHSRTYSYIQLYPLSLKYTYAPTRKFTCTHSRVPTYTRTHSTHMPTYTATHYTHTYWFAHTYTPGTHNNTNTCYMNQPRMKMWVLTETLRFEVFHGKTHRSRIITVRRSSTDVYHPEEKCVTLTPCTPWLVWRLVIWPVYPPWFWVTPAPLDGREWEPYS